MFAAKTLSTNFAAVSSLFTARSATALVVCSEYDGRIGTENVTRNSGGITVMTAATVPENA